jgi:CheY-like chemotaxis protein/DNA-binding XRE family transcriptional regulator
VRNENVKKAFGASVRFLRNRLGISQETLAERADVHRTYICDVEGGVRNVSLETIERLAVALGVSISALFAPAAGPAAEARPLKLIGPHGLVEILFVEDNPDDASLTLRALKRANIANVIDHVSDGAEALDFLFCRGKYAARGPASLPQLILLDLNVPKIDGLGVLRRIKADARTRDIPVVVLTVSSRGQDVVKSQRLGAQAYIVKPVDFRNFSEIVPKLKLQWAVLKSASLAGT